MLSMFRSSSSRVTRCDEDETRLFLFNTKLQNGRVPSFQKQMALNKTKIKKIKTCQILLVLLGYYGQPDTRTMILSWLLFWPSILQQYFNYIWSIKLKRAVWLLYKKQRPLLTMRVKKSVAQRYILLITFQKITHDGLRSIEQSYCRCRESYTNLLIYLSGFPFPFLTKIAIKKR